MIKVAVFGALGRMGRETVSAIRADEDLELTWAVDVEARDEGLTVLTDDVVETRVTGSVESLQSDLPDVMVDFTRAEEAVRNVLWSLDKGIHCVVGTTGIGEDDLGLIRARAGEGTANAIIAANFAIGAVLMMRFSEAAARYFDMCEVIELHHRKKLDSPSGTAIATAQRIAAVIDPEGPSPSREDSVEGARGGSVGPVRIHSVRLDGLVAHQEVIFGSTGQTLSIRHDTTDRSCFMPGVLMAVKVIADIPGLTIGLEPVLDL